MICAAAPAFAGPPSDVVRAVQAAAATQPLDSQAIRFTAIEPAGRGATIYEARRGPAGVTRTITDLSPQEAAAGQPATWAVDGRDTKPMAAETMDYFIGRIDAAIAAAPAAAACPDGPDYYAEHGAVGLSGACDANHPNAAIARALGLAEPIAP